MHTSDGQASCEVISRAAPLWLQACPYHSLLSLLRNRSPNYRGRAMNSSLGHWWKRDVAGGRCRTKPSVLGYAAGTHLSPRTAGQSGAEPIGWFHFQGPGTCFCLVNRSNGEHAPAFSTWPTSVKRLILVRSPIYRWEIRDRDIKGVAPKLHTR